MAHTNVKINGLKPIQYHLLKSPLQQVEKSEGALTGRKVSAFVHGMHVLANFFVRLFYAIFVTHRWESDLNLRDRLWKDLNNGKSIDQETLTQIRFIFNSLLLRLKNDHINVSIENKLIALENELKKDNALGNNQNQVNNGDLNHQVTVETETNKPVDLNNVLPLPSIEDTVNSLNVSNKRSPDRITLLTKLADQLIEAETSNTNIQENLAKLENDKDRKLVEARVAIITVLGVDHPFLNNVKIMKILTMFENKVSLSEEVKNAVIKDLVLESVLINLDKAQVKNLISLLEDDSSKIIFQQNYNSLMSKQLTYCMDLVPKLSGNNPLKDKPHALYPLFILNHPEVFGSFPGAILKIKDLIGTLANPNWKDDLTCLIKDELIKKSVRITTGLLLPGDLVCDYSQGRIEDFHQDKTLKKENGKNACGSICAEAILWLNTQKKTPTENQMYEILEKGIGAHKAKGYGSNAAVFGDLVEKINQHTLQGEKLLAIALDPSSAIKMDEFDTDRFSYPLLYPYQKEIGGGVSQVMQLMEGLSAKLNQTLYGVLTCGHETVMIYSNQNGSYSVFDSHGRSYLGVSKGASIRSFNTLQGVQDHFSLLYDNKEKFSMLIMSAAPSAQ